MEDPSSSVLKFVSLFLILLESHEMSQKNLILHLDFGYRALAGLGCLQEAMVSTRKVGI